MIQNYYILAGLVGVYLLFPISKGSYPELILVVGVLAMLFLSAGLSHRPKLGKREIMYLMANRCTKVFFSFFLGSFILLPIMIFFIHDERVAIVASFFFAYQISSLVVWKVLSKKYSVFGRKTI